MIFRLIACLESNQPFAIAWKRAGHIKNGHPFEKSTLIEKIESKDHPENDWDYVYMVNIRKCDDCGLIFHDCGMEYRHR